MFGARGKSRLHDMVGIDFGSSYLKAVALTGPATQMRLASMAMVPTPAGSIIDHQLHDIEALVKALKQLRRQLNVAITGAATAVTGSNVTSKIISCPSGLCDDELTFRVMQDAAQHIAFPLEEVSLDFERLGVTPGNPGEESVLLSVARTETITSRQLALKMAGFRIRVVDIGIHAQARAATLLLAPKLNHSRCVAMADIGAESLTFGVLERGEVIYSRLQGLAQDTEERVRQLQRNLQLFQSSNHSLIPDALFLGGGGSRAPELVNRLERELAMPVWEPQFERLGADVQACSQAPAFVTALGLALRSYTPCPI